MKKIQLFLSNEANHSKIFLFLIIIGLFSRIFYGFYSYGSAFLDEYVAIIYPALSKLQIGSEIVTEPYRNLLYPNIFYYILRIPNIFGINSPSFLAGFGNAVIGVFSVFGLWGLYRFSQNFLSSRNSLLVLFLGVFHPVLPVLSTKPLAESFSMFVVPWAFYFFSKNNASTKDFFWAGFFIAFSAFFRIQTGILVIGLSVTLILWLYQKKIEWKDFVFFHMAGFFVLILLGFSDVIFGRSFMDSTWKYVELNFLTNVMDSKWGKTVWHMYITFFSSLFIPPFSLLLLVPFFRSQKYSRYVFIIFISFVALHSFIDNKLERFMAPVIPLFLFLTILGYEKTLDGKLKLWERRFLWISGALMVILFPFVLTQRSQIVTLDAANYLREINVKKLPVYKPGKNYWFQAYYGFDYPEPIKTPNIEKAFEHSGGKDFYYLAYVSQKVNVPSNCHLKKTFEPDLVEALAYHFNPQRNKRRAPLNLYFCLRKDI